MPFIGHSCVFLVWASDFGRLKRSQQKQRKVPRLLFDSRNAMMTSERGNTQTAVNKQVNTVEYCEMMDARGWTERS